jgi:hypothetical protein
MLMTATGTLQELIAPSCVEFYSRDGHLLGTKETLRQHIQEITGIPLAASAYQNGYAGLLSAKRLARRTRRTVFSASSASSCHQSMAKARMHSLA